MEFHLTAWHLALLPLLGLGVAAVGTVAGLGGGFILVPILILLFPEASPATVTSISLTVVFLNASSATIGNLRARRIDLRTGLLLAISAAPAAVIGSIVAGKVGKDDFQVAFGAFLLFAAIYIVWRSGHVGLSEASLHDPNRLIRERRGGTFRFYVNELLAAALSPIGGFISSFFGIGGGIIHLPAMMFILKIPPRVATATGLLVLVPTSVAAVLTHITSGQFQEGWRRAGLLGAGALVGAQVGVRLGSRVNQRVILGVLALALVAVGLQQMLAGL